jgi:hypothetical protein
VNQNFPLHKEKILIREDSNFILNNSRVKELLKNLLSIQKKILKIKVSKE